MNSNNNVQSAPNRTIHDVVTGRKVDGVIFRPLNAGQAYLEAGSDYYVLRLTMFPRVRYFVKRNKDSVLAYTVYAKRFRNADVTQLDEPVGAAYLNPELKSHLEIKFPLLGRSVYMSLFPSEEV